MSDAETKLLDDLTRAWEAVYVHYCGEPPQEELRGPHGDCVKYSIQNMAAAIIQFSVDVAARQRIIKNSKVAN